MLWTDPIAVATTVCPLPSTRPTAVGVSRFVVVPSPSWPVLLYPHANNRW